MNNVDVTYETYAEQEVIAITTEDGLRVEIAAEDQETFYKLAHEVFGDPSTVAGRAYRSVLERETTSGMTVKELIQAGRQAALNEN